MLFLVTPGSLQKLGARPKYAQYQVTALRKNHGLHLGLLTKQKATMSISLRNFVTAPSKVLLNLSEKTELLDIADHYAQTSVKPSMIKHEIKKYADYVFV